MIALGKDIEPTSNWPYLKTAPQALAAGNHSATAFREVLEGGAELLQKRFSDDDAIEDLIHDRAHLVDIVLRAAWQRHAGRHAATGVTQLAPNRC